MIAATTYHKINALKKKIKVIQGGQAAGKNYAITQILINKAFEKKRTITVMSDTYDNLKDGAIKDFRDILENEGKSWLNAYNKSSHDLILGLSTIQFRYISDNKEHAGKSKRRDILYINEANKIGWNVASTFIGRTHEDIYIDLNPDRETWVHTEVPKIVDLQGNKVSEQIIVTYRDNEFCPESEIQYIESRKDNVNWYNIYGLGLTGTYSDRRIYEFDIINEIPDFAKRISSGLDFGISPDKTALIDIYTHENNLYLNERFSLNYLRQITIQGDERMSVAGKLKEIGYPKGWQIIADSASRTAILDIAEQGFNVIAVKKTTGAKMDMTTKIRSYNIFITKQSVNLKKDFEEYFWKIDKSGLIMPEPDGHEGDCIAAMRYGCMGGL